MLFASGGSAANSVASNLFRQIKTSIDKDQDGTVSRQELLDAKAAAQSGALPNGSDSLVDYLLSNYDAYIDPTTGAGITEDSLDAQEQAKLEAEQKAAEEAARQKEEEAKAEQQRAEQMRVEQEKARIMASDKEAINRDARATSLFKMAFKQLTGEDASAEDVEKWQKAIQNPTTDLDKARADVLAIRPELKERLANNGMSEAVLNQRREVIAQAGSQLDLGAATLGRLKDDYAHKPGSIQSILADFLNEFA